MATPKLWKPITCTDVSAFDLGGGIPGRVFDGAIPDRLLASLFMLAGRIGAVSETTGIANSTTNAFEGYDGTGFPASYFEAVATARDRAVDQWCAVVRALTCETIGLREINPARDHRGRQFTPAVVRQTTQGIDWHFDHAHLEYPRTPLDLGQGAAHYSVITYLNTPDNGGQLEIADWKPGECGAHPAASYPLSEELFRSRPRHRITPERGRTVLVSSEYAHRVLATGSARKFITMFIAIGPNGQAISFG